MVDVLVRAAALGAAGAFVYAAPGLSACWVSPKQPRAGRGACIFEFGCALITGAIGAAFFGPAIAGWRHLTDDLSLNALAVFVGLVFNPVAPVLINLAPRVTDAVIAGLKGKP